MSRTVSNGLVVLFEGIDGIGKSTQLKLAQEQLAQQDWAIRAARNLGGTPIGEALREAMLQPIPRPPLTDLYTSIAIQEALLESIRAERAAGKIVLLDRSPLSLAAYAIFGGGLNLEETWPYVVSGMEQLNAELIILYSGDVAAALERAHQKPGQSDYFESKSIDYFENVDAGYKAAVQHYDVHVINADQSIEAIHAETMSLINQALQSRA